MFVVILLCVKSSSPNSIIAETGFSSLTAKVYGIIAGIPIPFRLENPQACGRSIACPVKEGTDLVYKESMLVQRIFPSVSFFLLQFFSKLIIYVKEGTDLVYKESMLVQRIFPSVSIGAGISNYNSHLLKSSLR